MSLSVWFMMNLSGATQKSLVPCGDERDLIGAGKDGMSTRSPRLCPGTASTTPLLPAPLTTAAAVSTAMEAQLRMSVSSPQHSILRGEG